MSRYAEICRFCGAPIIGGACPRCRYVKPVGGKTVFTGSADFVGAPPTPPAVIERTPLGTKLGSGTIIEVTIGPVDVAATETVIALLAFDNFSGTALAQVNADARPCINDDEQTFGTANGHTAQIWSLPMNGTPIVGGFIVADFTGGDIPIPAAAMIALKVSTLVQSPHPADQPAKTQGNSANPDSGLTLTTSVANEFLCGFVANVGQGADLLGTWQNGFTAGQRVSSSGISLDLKEGFNIVSATGTYRAQILNQTSRRWAAICQTYRGNL